MLAIIQSLNNLKKLSFILFAACIFIIPDLHNIAADMGARRNRKIIVDSSARGKKIELKVGDEIEIELKSLGGTGYKWYFIDLDYGLFELIGEETRVSNKSNECIAGGPIMHIYRLKTRKPGHSKIKMACYRIWEGKEKFIDQFEIEVQINQ